MAGNRAEYESIGHHSPPPSKSIYLNPVFDDHDNAEDQRSLLNDTSSSNNLEQSPYEEVAVNVSNTDDPTELAVTFRSVFLGILVTCLISFNNQFFAFRTSPLLLSFDVAILLSFIISKLMAMILPKTIFNRSINPGPFTMKECTVSVIMGTVGSRTYQGVEALTVQRLYYGFYLNHFSSIIFILIMHYLAISVAGLLRRFLTWPAAMIWPNTLLACSLIRTLVNEKKFDAEKSQWKISRLKFFWLAVLFQFLWYWLPGYIFPLLSFFSFLCMIAPNHIIYSQITGSNGLAVGALEFDWNAWVAYLDSPILVPFWAHVNWFLGFICVAWIGTPLIYYTNTWGSKRMPIVSIRAFDSDGYFYNVTKLLNQNFHLNENAHKTYSRVYVSAGYAASVAFMFAGTTAVVVHTAFYHGKSIVEQFRSSLSDKKHDIHAKLMSYYPQAPDWWYGVLLVVTFVIAIIFCYVTKVMPFYMMFPAIALTFIFALTNCTISAIVNISLNSSTISDLLSGVIMPGKPIGYLVLHVYTYTCQDQIYLYMAGFKLAHYMKIPPRVILPLLLLSGTLSSIVHYVTGILLLNNIRDICTSRSSVWKCLNVHATYTASIVFGISRSFTVGQTYSPLLFGFLVGSIFPIISWYLWRTFPKVKFLALVNFPIFFMAANNFPPAPAVEYVSWFLVGFIFNYIIYRYAHDWWEKYAYVFSVAMSCGVSICALLIFATLKTTNTHFPQWWGLGGPSGDGCPLDTANYSGVIATDRDL